MPSSPSVRAKALMVVLPAGLSPAVPSITDRPGLAAVMTPQPRELVGMLVGIASAVRARRCLAG